MTDEDALQHWFTGRLAEHVASRGRRLLLGWDEVLRAQVCLCAFSERACH